MIKPLRQTNFLPGKGDCFKTCVAMLLELPTADPLPNFCEFGDAWWPPFQAWLGEHHKMFAVEVLINAGCLMSMPPGVPVILTGPSHAGDWLHSVVGLTREDGFEYLHDPNPTDKFLKDVTHVLFLAPLRPGYPTVSHGD